MKSLYDKIRIIKRFIKQYEKRKTQDKDFLNVLSSLVADLESDYITQKIKEKIK